MSAKAEVAVVFWNCCVIALLVCVLQALSYYWLITLYNFKWDITRSSPFTTSFDIGVGFTALGLTLIFLQEYGLTFGTMGTLASIIFMLESLKSMENDSNTSEVDSSTCKEYSSGLGALLYPTLGSLLFFGKAFIKGVQEQKPQEPAEDEVDGPAEAVHMRRPRSNDKETNLRQITKAWTFIRTQAEHLISQNLSTSFKMVGAPLAISTCFLLAFIVASWESFLLTFLCGVLQVVSCIWLVSLHNFQWGDTHNPSFELSFKLGVGGTLLGTFMLFIPSFGFSLFNLLYIAGTVYTLASILSLTETGKTFTEQTGRMLIEQVKSKFGAIYPHTSKWETFSDFFNSDIGGIAEGLCALLFPALGLLLGTVHVAWAWGLRGQKTEPQPAKTPVKSASNQQGQDNKRDNELEEFQNMVMKVFRFVILAAVLWFWGFALFLWICSCLLWGVFYSVQHKSANNGFIVCFTIGAFCTVLGVYLLDQSESGLTLFSVLYTVGTLCVLGSTLFVIEPWQQLKMAFDNVRAVSSSVMILFLGLTFFAALWWKSFIVALTFCLLHIISSIWYCLTYVQYRRIFTFHELTEKE